MGDFIFKTGRSIVLGCCLVSCLVQHGEAAAKPDIRTAAALANYDKVNREAIAYLQALPASSIENGLPTRPFNQWIESLLGTNLHWEMNDCGEGGNGGSDTPICVEVNQGDNTRPNVSISVAIGDSASGISDLPQFFSGGVMKKTVEHLADLPKMVRETQE